MKKKRWREGAPMCRRAVVVWICRVPIDWKGREIVAMADDKGLLLIVFKISSGVNWASDVWILGFG